MADEPRAGALRGGGRGHGRARGRDPRGPRAGGRVAARAPSPLHRRHQRRAGRADRAFALPRVSHRPRRPLHLSRPRPARGLCDARPLGAAAATCALSCTRWRTGSSPRSRTLGVEGERREGQIGVFVGEAKIASIGIRVRHWVSFHGVSLNVDPDLKHFAGIVPCGLTSPGHQPRRARHRHRYAARRCRAPIGVRGDASAPLSANWSRAP